MSTTLSYDELEKEIIQELKKNTIGVLATSEGNNVTARHMMLISDGLKISCFTFTTTRKFKQISANKNVALAINNIQIEGMATLKGHTSDPKNVSFLKAFEKLQPEIYKMYCDVCLDPESPAELIEIYPKRIAIYTGGYPDSKMDVLNTDKKTAIRYSGSDFLKGENYE